MFTGKGKKAFLPEGGRGGSAVENSSSCLGNTKMPGILNVGYVEGLRVKGGVLIRQRAKRKISLGGRMVKDRVYLSGITEAGARMWVFGESVLID